MREALDRLAPQRSAARVEPVRRARVEAAEPSGLVTAARPTLLERRLEAREFAVTVELDPPRGHNIEKLVQGAKLLKERGVEIVDINDRSPRPSPTPVLPPPLLVPPPR